MEYKEGPNVKNKPLFDVDWVKTLIQYKTAPVGDSASFSIENVKNSLKVECGLELLEKLGLHWVLIVV